MYVNKIKNKKQARVWQRPLWWLHATTASKLCVGSARLMLFTINKIRFYSTETLIGKPLDEPCLLKCGLIEL